MDLIDCKRCGGILDRLGKGTTAKCRNCGTVQTIPRLLDDRIAALYERASHLRRNSEYDKAIEIYENILNETPEDAEAYWSIILCRYGLVYVEDSKTQKRFPTITRIQKTSLLADEDYKAALKHADNEQKQIYKDEAEEIERIRLKFLTISREEQDYDVFICYKDKDERGRATEDRAIAMELYNRLHREGLKVFFAYVSLDDKLGHEYEPYIFSALNSAKVMIVLGTKAEYFTAPWLKNEWSRFISLIKAGEKKTIIAAYKNMEGGDLPDELHLQAQDMTKIGYLENLCFFTVREIERSKDKKEPASHSSERNLEEELEKKLQEKLEKKLEEELEAERKKQEKKRREEERSRKKEDKKRTDSSVQFESPYSSPPAKPPKKSGCGCGIVLLAVVLTLLVVIVYFWNTISIILDQVGLLDNIQSILESAGINSEDFFSDETENSDVQLDPPDDDPSYNDPSNGDEENREPGVGDQFMENDFTYEIVEGGVKVIGYSGTAEELEIPWDAGGYEVVSLGAMALSQNAALRVLTVPASVREIDANAFAGCANLTELVIPFVGKTATESDTQNAVLGYFFDGSIPESLRKVTVTSQTSIPDYAFQTCSNIREIRFETPVSRIGQYAFADCSLLSELSFDSKPFTKLGDYAFKGCASLKSLYVGDGVTELGTGVFARCSLLEELQLPDSLEIIGRDAFAYCSSLTELTIPTGVTTIQLPILSDCNRLERLTVPFIGEHLTDTANPFGAFFTEVQIKVDPCSTSHDDGMTSQSVNIGVSFDRSNYYCYRIPQSIREVTVTQQTAVPDYAFMNCDLIQRVAYEKNLSAIGAYSFSGCSDLTTCQGNLSADSSIGDYAFSGCVTLTECLIPEGVARIGENAFINCTSVERVEIPSSVKVIGGGAFGGCSALSDLVIHKGVTTIGSFAFRDCTALREARIPTGVKSMSSGIFFGCTSLTSLDVPFLGASVDDKSSDATLGYLFGGTGSYSSTINKTSDSSEYTSQAPYNGSSYYYLHYPIPKSLRHVTVTEQTYVADYAFKNCDLLQSVGYAKKITSVGQSAFGNCSSLETIYYAGSYEDYESILFSSGWNTGMGEVEVMFDSDFGY